MPNVNFDQDEFVEMLILDGLFIIELLHKHRIEDFRTKVTLFFNTNRFSAGCITINFC